MISSITKWFKKPHIVEVKQATDGKWYWHEKGGNGEITCSSQRFYADGWSSEADARRAAMQHCKARRIYRP